MTNGRLDRSMSCTPKCSSKWCTIWLAFDCDTPFALAAREKLPMSTTSQKVFKKRRCISGSGRASGGIAAAGTRLVSGDNESPAITYDESRYADKAIPMGFATNVRRIDWSRNSALAINYLNIVANQD